jgi:chorismate-pyruvate lyase
MSAIGVFENLPELDAANLTPLQRILLITDGTLTEILEAYFLERIELVKLSEHLLTSGEMDAPLPAAADERILERKINLRGVVSGRLYVYAKSLVFVNRLDSSFQTELLETNIPLGRLWRSHRLETFKELVNVECRPAATLAAQLACAETTPVLGRVYDVYSARRAVMRIAEYFPATPSEG